MNLIKFQNREEKKIIFLANEKNVSGKMHSNIFGIMHMNIYVNM